MKNAIKVVANRLHNYSRCDGTKTEVRSQIPKTGSENGKPIFIEKFMPFSVMVGQNEPAKLPSLTEKAYFCCNLNLQVLWNKYV